MEPLEVYTRWELLGNILDHDEKGIYESVIAEEFLTLRFSRILDFLRYIASRSETGPAVPEGYEDFRKGVSDLFD